MTSFSSARLGVLFRQRAQLTDDLRHAHAKAERLTLEHNELVRKAGQAATDGGRQRAQLQASRKGEEAARAREHADALSRKLHQKETEIVDLIGALWAASQSLLSADTIRQLNDHLGAISDHLERADSRAATLMPELNNLRTAILNQSRLISSLNIERTDSHDGRITILPSRRIAGFLSCRWAGDAEAPRSASLAHRISAPRPSPRCQHRSPSCFSLPNRAIRKDPTSIGKSGRSWPGSTRRHSATASSCAPGPPPRPSTWFPA